MNSALNLGSRKVLVTGAGGFVGSAVVRSLLRRGWVVDAVARPGRPMPEAANSLLWHAADLLDPPAVSALIEKTRPAVLIHLAWDTGHGEFWESPRNLDWAAATLSLARSFATAGGTRFIGLGSCAEYSWAGEQADATALDEEASLRDPLTVYGAAKNATFDLLTPFFFQRKIGFAWGRLFYPYGPGDERPTLVPDTIRRLLAAEPAPCTAGTQRRDFVFIDDAGEAVASLAESRAEGAFNIGAGKGTSVAEIVMKVADTIGRPDLVRLGALPTRPDDPARIVASIDRISGATGWSPRVTLDEGIQSTVEWWRQREQKTGGGP